MTKAEAETEELTEALKKIGRTLPEILKTLDALTREHTGFPDFRSLIYAEGNPPEFSKRPPHPVSSFSQNIYAEYDLLALAYNMAQQARNDPRRSFRS